MQHSLSVFLSYLDSCVFVINSNTFHFIWCYCIAAASIDPSKTRLTLDPLARLIGMMGSSGVVFPPEVEALPTFRPIGTASVGAEEAEEEALSHPDPQ